MTETFAIKSFYEFSRIRFAERQDTSLNYPEWYEYNQHRLAEEWAKIQEKKTLLNVN